MSGAFGWHKSSSTPEPTPAGHSYEKAKQEYKPKTPVVTGKKIGDSVIETCSLVTTAHRMGTCSCSAPRPGPTPANPWKRNIATAAPVVVNKTFPDAKHELKSTAANVIIACMDVTSSMQDWPQEIFRRLPLLFQEACGYLGTDDLEILFIAHGDARTDNFPVQVSRFGKGEELDQILASFYMKCGGGGQGDESHELVAYYLLKRVDVSSAQNVYTFFVTDEAACDKLDWNLVRNELGLFPDFEMEYTMDVFASLMRRMKLFTILCETKNSYYDPVAISKRWEANVGKQNILPLDDSRRVVDVMLGTMAKLTGQLDQFTKNLTTRQEGSQYAAQNIQTVQKSIALVGGTVPKAPNKKKKPLI